MKITKDELKKMTSYQGLSLEAQKLINKILNGNNEVDLNLIKGLTGFGMLMSNNAATEEAHYWATEVVKAMEEL